MAIKRPFWNCFLPKVNQVIAEHICQIKKGSDGNFFLKSANELFFGSGHSN